MKRAKVIIIGFIVGALLLFYFCYAKPQELFNVLSIKDVVRLFPRKPEDIEKRTKQYIRQAKKQVRALIDYDDPERNFSNTVKALDNVLSLSDAAIFSHVVELLEMVSPHADIRKAAHTSAAKLKAFFVDIMANKKIYDAFKAYLEQAQELTEEQQYFIAHLEQQFKRNGLHLPKDELEQVKALQKKIEDLSLQFAQNIASDNRFITVTQDELTGLDPDFIDTLEKNDAGELIVGIDYPTYNRVMQQCTNATVRQRLYHAFSNRAYPDNEPILQEILSLRSKLAQLLGYDTYADYDVADQMIETTDHASSFLNSLIAHATEKEHKEFQAMTAQLPEGVTLENGTLAPWDIAFSKEAFKKRAYDLDEQHIAQYFPVEQTLEGLLAVYESFFALTFQEVVVQHLWSNDVRALKVFDTQADQLLGYILLDLYPRAHKYSHACNITIVPTVFGKDSKPNIGVSAIVANFPKPHGDTPALLKRSDVQTFFHEFGHALHGILGRTHMGTLSGTETKTDFVEMPSQMLEEWLYDPEILKMISEHYQTQEPLPDDSIERIISVKHIDSGYFIKRQSFLSKLSLNYHRADANLSDMQQQLHEQIMTNYAYDPENHFYAAFGHLTEYGAKYYGYLWSKVFALDLFSEIKKHGLLNPEIGTRYAQQVLAPGGSKDPNQLLRDFLGRAPSEEPFFKDMGL